MSPRKVQTLVENLFIVVFEAANHTMIGKTIIIHDNS